jgi:hypothetical protein
MSRIALVIPILLFALSACMSITAPDFAVPQIVTESVELDGAENVTAKIDMPAGELRLSGGTAKLMEGEFRYTSAALEPSVRYEATGFRGRLTVEGSGESSTNASGENHWAIRLNDEVPLDLDVSLGAGESNLDLRGMTLRNVDANIGVGECEINLVGEWDRNFTVNVKGGIGEATIRVPASIGVIAHATGGIGEISARGFQKDGDSYVTEAYGESPITITIDAKGGIGEINLIAE